MTQRPWGHPNSGQDSGHLGICLKQNHGWQSQHLAHSDFLVCVKNLNYLSCILTMQGDNENNLMFHFILRLCALAHGYRISMAYGETQRALHRWQSPGQQVALALGPHYSRYLHRHRPLGMIDTLHLSRPCHSFSGPSNPVSVTNSSWTVCKTRLVILPSLDPQELRSEVRVIHRLLRQAGPCFCCPAGGHRQNWHRLGSVSGQGLCSAVSLGNLH